MSRTVVIGGVAAGMSAASQARRRATGSEVVVLERGPHVSYGACGMPYNILDAERSMDDLVVITPERFRTERGIDVRTRHDVLGLDLGRRVVRGRDADGLPFEFGFDSLVIATGARAIRPPLPGLDLPGVFLLRELTDGIAVKSFLAARARTRAVIIGAGYIGMEMAEALRGRGLEVVVLEKAPQILPGFDPRVVEVVARELARAGVSVEVGVSVHGVEASGDQLVVATERGRRAADLVLVSIGVRPAVALARDAGVALGASGAIATDDHMRTSVAGVYAAGDCAEAFHLVSRRPAYVPLGTTANKQGKVAGANAAGGDERFGGIVGTAAFKVFDLEVGRTGLTLSDAAAAGLDAITSASTHRSRGHAYPGSKVLTTVLVLERKTGRLLGAQMVGAEGVTGRVDVLATALTSGMSVQQLEQLDLAYAPPLAPVYDPLLIAAAVGGKDLAKANRRDAGARPPAPSVDGA